MILVNKLKKNKLLFIVGLIYAGMFVVTPDNAVQSISNSVYYLLEMLQVLPVIFMLTVIIEAWIPKEIITRRFGENSGFSGNLLSLLLGSFSAGPIYAAFPLSKMLIVKGASITNIVIILSSWAVVKFPMLVIEVKFLGANFMVVRWLLTVFAIFIMAYLVAKLVKREDLPKSDVPAGSPVFEIREQYCNGCGLCVKMLPDYYEMCNNKAHIKNISVTKDTLAAVNLSAEKCPAKAISFSS